MSSANSNNPPNVKPFGDTDDPLGFYQLLVAHVTWLAVHNFSLTTTTKRALYVRAFGLWCLERDIVTPCTISKPMIESFQRHLFTHRQVNGKPLAWSSQHLHLKEVKQFFSWLAKQNYIPFSPAAEIELPKQPKTLPKSILSADEVERILQQPDITTPSAFAIEPSSKFCTQPAFVAPKSVRCTSTTSTSIAKSSSFSKARANAIVTFPSACELSCGLPATSNKLVSNWPSIPKNAHSS